MWVCVNSRAGVCRSRSVRKAASSQVRCIICNWFCWPVLILAEAWVMGLKMMRRGSTSKGSSMLFVTTGCCLAFASVIYFYISHWLIVWDVWFEMFSLFSGRAHSLQRLARTQDYFSSLPKHHQKMLSNYDTHLTELRTCVEHNYEIIKLITSDVSSLFENVKHDDAQVHKRLFVVILFFAFLM